MIFQEINASLPSLSLTPQGQAGIGKDGVTSGYSLDVAGSVKIQNGIDLSTITAGGVASGTVTLQGSLITTGTVTASAFVQNGMPGGLIPKGGIIIWTQSDDCPAGFIENTLFSGLFPTGRALFETPGDTGGSNGHEHTFSGTTSNNDINQNEVNPLGSSPVADKDHKHNFSGTTSVAPNLPPFIVVLFCEKE